MSLALRSILPENTNCRRNQELLMDENASTNAFVVEFVVNSRKYIGSCVVRLLAIRLERELSQLLYLRLAERPNRGFLAEAVPAAHLQARTRDRPASIIPKINLLKSSLLRIRVLIRSKRYGLCLVVSQNRRAKPKQKRLLIVTFALHRLLVHYN